MPTSPRRTVLVVDDDPALLGSLEFSLGAEGYLVRGCLSSAAALEPGGADPACLVIDYRLPDMDGIDLVDRLRKQGTDAPLILITTNPDAQCRARAARRGAVIVEKPLLGDQLLDQIRVLVGETPPRA